MKALLRFQDLTETQLVSSKNVPTIYDDEGIQESKSIQSLKDEGYITRCIALAQPLKKMGAQQHLLDQGYEADIPRFKKNVRKVGERLVVPFPRCIFVGIDLSSVRWDNINNKRIFFNLLMRNDLNLAKALTRITGNLSVQEIEDGFAPVSSLEHSTKDERALMIEGVSSDKVALFESMDDHFRVQWVLSFVGREKKMTLPTHAVKAA
jgi:transcriptional antiterminator RfaH